MNTDNTSEQHQEPAGHEDSNGQVKPNIIESILKHPIHGINFRTAALWFTKYEIMTVKCVGEVMSRKIVTSVDIIARWRRTTFFMARSQGTLFFTKHYNQIIL